MDQFTEIHLLKVNLTNEANHILGLLQARFDSLKESVCFIRNIEGEPLTGSQLTALIENKSNLVESFTKDIRKNAKSLLHLHLQYTLLSQGIEPRIEELSQQ